jgi:hypothetical protein
MSKVPHARRPYRYSPKQTIRLCPQALEDRRAPKVGYFVNLDRERADGVVGGTDSSTDTATARTLASGTFDVGCAVTFDDDHRGRLYSSGSFDFTATTAGAINLFSQDITLQTTRAHDFGSPGVVRMPNAKTTTLSLAA